MAETLKTAICVLCEDELDLIVNKVGDPDDRKSFSEVCKLWYKVESLNRSSICLLGPEFPRQVVSRFSNLVTFETRYSITDDDLVFLGQTCPKLEVIDLSVVHCPGKKASPLLGLGLLSLAKGCPKLSKVMLNGGSGIIDSIPTSLVSLAPSLTHLDLGWCRNVSDDALEAIGSSSSISYLNLRGCSPFITDKGLGFLGNGSISKTLKTLILDFISSITDVGVSHLPKMRYLEHLSLGYCLNMTDIGGAAISTIPTLKELNLGSVRYVSDHTVVALAQNCPNLQGLDLSHCDGITGAGIRAFWGHAGLQTVVLSYVRITEVEASVLEHLVLSCGSLKSILLDPELHDRIWPLMQEQVRRRFFMQSDALDNALL